ncbi:hypothetical protein FD728_04670 (plasmid) [Pantoea sp. Aalb]|nr:hypothetical protein [Pantoea sp. Aalb]
MKISATPYREAIIRLCALRLRYQRACRNPSFGVVALATLMSQLEDAERDVERYEQKSIRI